HRWSSNRCCPRGTRESAAQTAWYDVPEPGEQEACDMSQVSQAEPIKLGFLMDYIGESRAMDDRSIFSEPLELVFREGFESGMIDRPIEIVYRSAQGLPRGTVKAVIDAFGELVDEGCVAVLGPNISDNAVAVRPEIERRFCVPAISVCG